jgi:two-component system OmpR family sensor kinase
VGRLFWKFFFFFLLAQLTTVVGVSSAIWLRHRDAAIESDREASPAPMAAGMLDRAAVTLEQGGEPALRTLLENWSWAPLPAVYAVDPAGREVLGRAIPALPPGTGATDDASEAQRGRVRRVTLADGRSFVLFVDTAVAGRPPGPGGPGRAPEFGRPGGPGGPGERGRPGPGVFPFEPIAGGVIASLLFAALLAWYVAKPIRNLRGAFEAAGQGNLELRIGDGMGRRRDELVDLGHAFDRTAERLRLLVDGQRRLLHDVSHELRSPLARLQAAIGLARQQPERAEASLTRIEREAERMDGLVDELLTLSRVEAGVGARLDDEVRVAELVADVVDDAAFEAEAASRPVSFARDLAALESSTIRGNAEMLHRALDNVVRNAMRFSPPGGTIAIAGTRDAERRHVALTVSDEGPGVPETELESIFAAFFKSAHGGRTEGHGLGLAIARRIVEMHGGSIRAANRQPTGLRVEIRIPA